MPNGWEWAILVLIALLLLGGARLSGISRESGAGESASELNTEGSDAVPNSPASPAAIESSGEESSDPHVVTESSSEPGASAPTEND